MGLIWLNLLTPDHSTDIVPIGYQGSGEIPFAPKDIGEEPFVGGNRHTIYGLISQHESPTASLCGSLEGWKEPRTEFARA